MRSELHYSDVVTHKLILACNSRYKTLPLSYIANELAFDDTTAAHEFLSRWNSATYVPEPPKATVPDKPISISLSAQPKVAKPHHMVKKHEEPAEEEDKRQLDCKVAHPHLLAAAQTFVKVDIKVRDFNCYILSITLLNYIYRHVGPNLI